MILPEKNVVFAVVVNLTIFLVSFFLSMLILAKLGWSPRKDQKGLALWELFLLVIVFGVLMTVICFRCSIVVDGVVAGVVLSVLLNGIYELKRMQTGSK